MTDMVAVAVGLKTNDAFCFVVELPDTSTVSPEEIEKFTSIGSAPPGVSKWGANDDKMEFLCQDGKVPYFFLTLFVEYSEAYGHAMSVPANFRKVDLGELTRKEGKTSLLQTLSDSYDNTILDQTMFLFPYEICSAEDSNYPKNVDKLATIKSLALGNYKNGRKAKYGQLQYSTSQCCAAFVSERTYVTTCKLLGIDGNKFEEPVMKETHMFSDWSALFRNAEFASGQSKADLQKFVETLNLSNDPLMDVPDDCPLEHCHMLVRKAIQKATPLRFAMPEIRHHPLAPLTRNWLRPQTSQ